MGEAAGGSSRFDSSDHDSSDHDSSGHSSDEESSGHHSNPAKRIGAIVVGGIILLVGVALLILPGPGLLLVLGGLLILANEFPKLDKYVEPVQKRAMKATEESVSSPLRIAGSVLAGLALIAAGIVWGLNKQLWLGGWPTGSSLILSGVVLLALLGYSYRRVRAKRADSNSGNDLTRS